MTRLGAAIERLAIRTGILATPEQSARFDAVDRELDELERHDATCRSGQGRCLIAPLAEPERRRRGDR
jgi:hypothetical protein